MIYFSTYKSPLGKLTLESDGQNLTGLWIKEQNYHRQPLGAQPLLLDDNLPIFQETKRWLQSYFASLKPEVSALPLAPKGNEFRERVWKILLKIPYGKVTTYGKIARQIADQMGKTKMSPQAVGGAVGHNPISIVIPCHRVIGANGNLVGYGGGISNKAKLLKLEGLDLTKLS
ncbi:MAG: methylated-DNA--[protein]-cysteine S-methyltransferase [Deltaproteobacteria bacterium]|nr:methylated-DNA--[protein]-cysteine S-methyltransferase [Deltaproteobacteria bacterium]